MLRNLYILIFITIACVTGCLRVEPGNRRAYCDPVVANRLASNIDHFASTQCDEAFCEPSFHNRPRFAVPQRISNAAQGVSNATHAAVSAVAKRLGLLQQRPKLTDRIHDLKKRYRLWRRSLEEKSQAPPWPRFHPVPTRDVFSPTESTTFDAPLVYGRFASESADLELYDQSTTTSGIYQEVIPPLER